MLSLVIKDDDQDPLLPRQQSRDAELTNIIKRIEMGEMAFMFYNKIGRFLFYLCIGMYYFNYHHQYTCNVREGREAAFL